MIEQPQECVDEWRKTITQYKESKTKLPWGANPPVTYITEKNKKELDAKYNPVLQRYTDSSRENHVRAKEQQEFVHTLAKNKVSHCCVYTKQDRALRYEQTFNIITFEDKLKGLESHPDYPKEKPWKFKGGSDTNVNYNIISGLAFQQHHYAPPDKRPPEKKVTVKQKETTTTGLRDYNIITNRYLELHEDKSNTDKLIEKYELAEKYWKTHVYDPVSGQFYDPNKEEEFLKLVQPYNHTLYRKQQEESKTHGQNEVYKLPISVQKEGLLYNPVNMKVEDPKRLEEKDIREKKKKQRFEIRYDVENDLRVRGIEDIEKEKLQKLNRVNYRRYVEHLDRGFDILTNEHFDSPEMQKRIHKPLVAEKPKVWDIIEGQKTAYQTQPCPTQYQEISESPAYYRKKSENNNEGYEDNNGYRPPLQPSSKRSQAGSATQSRRHSEAVQPQSKRSSAAMERLTSKNVLSQAGAEHLGSRSNASSNRSIRTGAFQRVPINH
eukprot:TRINITY_DN71043_c0_g1_i1.p3 TRINITY_DN71043_c0_g1~~TRINITY_DN71043_c0_g1_i1.p3  ORF type:complete len:493 (+),score=56.06 TRINITY_DN71043_c0_g1_i1:140-1618(+)